ncbi:MAG: FAD-binding protein [Candidatus Dormibacteria bacterium]
MSRRSVLTGWGRTAPTAAALMHPRGRAEVARLLADASPRGLIARGLGRAYGDAAQNGGGTVVSTARLDGAGSPGAEGFVTVGAGAGLDALMQRFVPLGWTVPVSPGTRFVTVGGAIAADIHGKNHHRDGTFGAHVSSLRLETPTGPREVGATQDPELFWATIGGMGLTGVITEVTLRLHRVSSAWMRVDTDRADSLDDLLARMSGSDDAYRYSVAWLDSLAAGRRLGRGVLTRGDVASADEVPASQRASALRFAPVSRLVAPPWVPDHLLNPLSVRAFNEAWFRRSPRRQRGRVMPFASFFHPLDGIRGWNRLYGASGFVQYQFVVPLGAEAALRAVLQRLADARVPSFLTVLKRFGPANSAPLSFPLAGWTLALDIPARVHGLGALLDTLDEVVAVAGGRVYLAKDSRLRPDVLSAMYPRLAEWRAARDAVDPDRVLQSDLNRRLDLTGQRA